MRCSCGRWIAITSETCACSQNMSDYIPSDYIPYNYPYKYDYTQTTKSPYKCPVCDGTGLVSRPQDVPGDQNTWSASSTGSYKCHACKGSGIIWG